MGSYFRFDINVYYPLSKSMIALKNLGVGENDPVAMPLGYQNI